MIPHNKPTLGYEEEQAVIRVIKSGQLSEGQEVDSFEDEFCENIGLKKGHAVAVSSGTSALFLALWSLKAQGKKIHFPVYVCQALRHAIGLIGGQESPIDVELNSPNIDIQKMEEQKDITIIPHMFGIPIDLTSFKKDRMIEDCAQSLGAKVNNQHVGLQGEIGIFSFYATKIITSGGQGGMLVSKNKEIIDAVKDYREYDYRRDNKKRFNFKMTEIQGAIGREQLKKLPQFLEKREKIFIRYKEETGLNFLDSEKPNIKPIRYRAIAITKNPEKMISNLKKHNIKAVIPIEDWELLGNKTSFPNASKLCDETVSLPIYPSLKDKELELIISTIKE